MVTGSCARVCATIVFVVAGLGSCGQRAEDTNGLASGDLDATDGNTAVQPTDSFDADVANGGGSVDVGAKACVELHPKGTVPFVAKINTTQKRTFELSNCGDLAVDITRIRWDPQLPQPLSFTLELSGLKATWPSIDETDGPTLTKPATLLPGAKVSFAVVYKPTQVAPTYPDGKPIPEEAHVIVRHAASAQPLRLHLTGQGVKHVCPVAFAQAKEGTAVIPNTMLHLKGSASYAAIGSLKKWSWTVKQPSGSNQVFVPGPSFPDPTFTTNAAGDYEFCLEVFDDEGRKSCHPSCVTVSVVVEASIHVELLWKTPADPDETDTGPAAGANMDLHFAHPKAYGPDRDCDNVPDPWFSVPFDVFWFNPKPKWHANPKAPTAAWLDVDDTDGAGPENIVLDDPQGQVSKPMAYDIGVHYRNDHGFQTSYATVNVYILGVLALQISKVKMNVLDMWHVGRINWPNTMAQGVLDPFHICYQSGDPCKGGKKWRLKGDYCIARCYLPKAFAKYASTLGWGSCKK